MKKKINITVIGLGYVGLPLLSLLAEKNYNVVGFDIKIKIIQNLKKNISHIEDIKEDDLKKINKLKVKFTSNYNDLKLSNIFIVCVPTPLLNDKSPDNSYLNSVADILRKINLSNKLIINESTTYPGATKEIFGKIFQEQKLTIGRNGFLAFSPERVDPGNKKFKTNNIPKLVSGQTKACLKFISSFYSQIFKIHKVSNIETAEFTKIYENIFRSINISFANEMKVLSHKMNINIYEVIKSASTKPFGFLPFYPSPGFGGHCIPVDPFLLAWKARKHNFFTRFIELSGQINETMPNYIVTNILKILIAKKINLSKSKILLIGLSYKKNSSDIRETPAKKTIQLLQNYKIKLYYHDNLVDRKEIKKNIHFKNIKSVEINLKNLKKFDCCIILSDHDYINYDFLKKHAKFIVDTRGRYFKNHKNIIQF
jgi:UDP-N-acetyl-D-glucosamine dehydrogenase